jgi:thiol-disulfide isomerase/thioredoxin
MRAFPARWVAVAGAAVLLSACGLQEGLDQQSQSTPAPSHAPAVDGTTLTGASISWSALHGHPIVLDFWASWCGPCRAEQADINQLYKEYAGRGVVFLGVDLRDDNAAALSYQRDLAVPYQSVPDASEQISAAYDVAAPPTIVVVDQRGVIARTYLGTVVGVSDELNRLL